MRQEEDGILKVVSNGTQIPAGSANYPTYYHSLFASQDRDFLISPSGTQVKISELEGKVVGIYFSANWYPPCQNFTKLLIDVYEQLKTTIAPATTTRGSSKFEVVFVSSDEDLDAFNNYHSSMPWLAIPFSDLESKKSLNGKFDVEGIPCLIILQPNANADHQSSNKKDDEESGAALRMHDGVELIYRYGVRAFPFTKERLEELLLEEKEKHESQTLLNLLTNQERGFVLAHPNSAKQVQVASLKGKTIGLYFSAQWCLPCARFTPKLISTYHKIKHMLTTAAAGDGGGGEDGEEEDFEIVFVSSDHSKTDFDSYFATMPWLALPFDDPTIKNLTKYFDVRGIPSLIILGPDGKTVSKNGRSLVNLYEEDAYPFTEARVEVLEKQMDEEAKKLPTSEFHSGHRHQLTLVSQGSGSGGGGGHFICCDCDEQGSGWAYQCIDCGYEIHPKCVRAADPGPMC